MSSFHSTLLLLLLAGHAVSASSLIQSDSHRNQRQLDSSARLKNCEDWARSNGIRMYNVELGLGEHGAGLFVKAGADVPAASIVLIVPIHMVINARLTLSDPVIAALYPLLDRPASLAPEFADAATVLWLVRQRLLGTYSTWGPYLDALPTAEEMRESHVLFAQARALTILSSAEAPGSQRALRKYIVDATSAVRQVTNVAAAHAEHFDNRTWDELYELVLWAYVIVLTRSDSGGADGGGALVPIADFLNHSPGFPKIFINRDRPTNEIDVYFFATHPTKRILGGEEVLRGYFENRCSMNSLTRFGFTSPEGGICTEIGIGHPEGEMEWIPFKTGDVLPELIVAKVRMELFGCGSIEDEVSVFEYIDRELGNLLTQRTSLEEDARLRDADMQLPLYQGLWQIRIKEKQMLLGAQREARRRKTLLQSRVTT